MTNEIMTATSVYCRNDCRQYDSARPILRRNLKTEPVINQSHQAEISRALARLEISM